MSLVTNVLLGTFLVERPVVTSVDEEGAPVIEYQNVIGDTIVGNAQVIGSSQYLQQQLAGQQESFVKHRFYCEYGFDLKRGDRITRIDIEYPVIYIINKANMQNIQGGNDHTMCVCEEYQEGFKVR